MRRTKTIRLIRRMCWYGALVAAGALSLAAGAQQSGSQAPPPAQSKQQTQHKSAAEENPFPSDVSKHAAQQKDQAAPPPSPDASGAGQQTPQKPKNAAEENPFPEDVSKGAAAAKDSGSSSGSGDTSSSSGGDTSSSNPNGDIPPDGDVPKGNGRRKLQKPSDKDIESGSLAGEGRAAEDVRVGRFYLGAGNYQGAYNRFVEATRMDPINTDAIYGLAVSAAGLHHTDEALTNYKLYLQIAPDGNDAKSARKAIHSLSK
jgi:tetratricopeptide (TPR) repeat protein